MDTVRGSVSVTGCAVASVAERTAPENMRPMRSSETLTRLGRAWMFGTGSAGGAKLGSWMLSEYDWPATSCVGAGPTPPDGATVTARPRTPVPRYSANSPLHASMTDVELGSVVHTRICVRMGAVGSHGDQGHVDTDAMGPPGVIGPSADWNVERPSCQWGGEHRVKRTAVH